ncbi:MAG TPA: class II D-tagatose-bisphosphate aldolase, non-catalytic subunit [Candidatus Dormibacteraeota bacterium]|nr:class II D-tagatose-bisphosphate aldolase, non-catalytic subunit [Candidatus Dormibacteraeota bacterium]
MSAKQQTRGSTRSPTTELKGILQANQRGEHTGIYSVCSANQAVLEAAMAQALRDDSLLCIESTSNQVNQYGGYTGQTARDFAGFVSAVAREMKFPAGRIVLGGDHLGPHAWRSENANEAMEKARELVKSCVRAGYTKIHLDASMRCADDGGDGRQPLEDRVVSARAAELCAAAEEAHKEMPQGSTAPLYVIGTEVPVPGGEQLEARAPEVTSTTNLARTLAITRQAFAARALDKAWQRVIAVVVQPGVEFGDATLFPYDAPRAKKLAAFAGARGGLVYEAHSTDYQTRAALREMVRDHFAILKVGPWLTFAYREAVFALEAVEKEWLGAARRTSLSGVTDALEAAMQENPSHWKNYHHGDEAAQRIARKYSYSDRSRYYWSVAKVRATVERLIQTLDERPAPVSLLSQFLPNQAAQIRAGELANRPRDLIRSKICEVTSVYSFACAKSLTEMPRGRKSGRKTPC